MICTVNFAMVSFKEAQEVPRGQKQGSFRSKRGSGGGEKGISVRDDWRQVSVSGP